MGDCTVSSKLPEHKVKNQPLKRLLLSSMNSTKIVALRKFKSHRRFSSLHFLGYGLKLPYRRAGAACETIARSHWTATLPIRPGDYRPGPECMI